MSPWLASTWQLLTNAGGRRVPTVGGGVLGMIGLAEALLNGHTSAIWWMLGMLACFLGACGWAYHDLRLERDALRAQLATAAQARHERLWTVAHRMYGEIGHNLRRIEQAISTARWWQGHDLLPAYAWTDGQETLLELGAHDAGVHTAFGAVKRAYDMFNALNTMLEPGRTHVLPQGIPSEAELPSATIEAARTAQSALVALVPALHPS